MHIFFFNSNTNLGGAGGFNYGMRWAVEAGYKYLWLMDDDCLPEQNALEKLLNADTLLEGKYGWLSSIALWTDGTECKMNRQKLVGYYYKYIQLLKYGLVQADQATFVSLFLTSETIRLFGLPIKEFFIWGDDIEYTRRIAVRGGKPSFIVAQSEVIHAMKTNTGSSIATDEADRLDRYYYAYRNEAFTYRQEGIKGVCYYLAKCFLNIGRIICKAPDHCIKRIWIICSSMVRGLFFCPNIEKL